MSLWVITESDGTIYSAHCRRCMAGQGECCSHIASILFYIETYNRYQEKVSCTGKPCEWILPCFKKDTSYCEVEDIDFSSASNLKQKLDELIETLTTASKEDTTKQTIKQPIAAPTDDELSRFYAKLNSCKTKPVVLSLVPEYSHSFVSKSRNIKTIPDLYDKKYLDMEYHKLLDACATVNYELTDDEIRVIEKDTQEQAQGGNFFRHRAGRIGASVSKQASHTNPAQPSISLIKRICYPNIFNISNEATKHGCKHEGTAIAAYEQIMSKKHKNLKIEKCGIFINKECPWIHATPDFLVSCDCCGKGCGEVKCPYCLTNTTFEEYMELKSTCLTGKDGNYTLKRDHQYFYQVQQQLFTTELNYCDFVVCSIQDQKIQFFCQRIEPCTEHWHNVLPKLNHFWRFCVLPEVIGRWYTQKRNLTLSQPDPKAVCFCRNSNMETVVECSNKECPIGTYHLCCFKLSKVPKTSFWPLCHKAGKQKQLNCDKDEITKKAIKLDSICMCKVKALQSDKLIECHNASCKNGKYFHLHCLKYKRTPNNAKTTWLCSECGNKQGKKRMDKSSVSPVAVPKTNITQHRKI